MVGLLTPSMIRVRSYRKSRLTTSSEKLSAKERGRVQARLTAPDFEVQVCRGTLGFRCGAERAYPLAGFDIGSPHDGRLCEVRIHCPVAVAVLENEKRSVA